MTPSGTACDGPTLGGRIAVFVQDTCLFQFLFILSVSCQDHTGLNTNPGLQPGNDVHEGLLNKELAHKGMLTAEINTMW